MLITFEGAEGSGKSTQIRSAVAYLKKKGYPVVFYREPGGTSAGEAIRRILLDQRLKEMTPETELFLYLAARSQLVKEKVGPALKAGKIVVLDRYEDSTVAYQGYGGKIPWALLRRICRAARGRVVPHLTFLLDVETGVGLKRSGRKDRIERKPVSFHRRVRRGFLAIARKEPKRFVVLSSKEPIGAIRRKIEEALDERF